MPESKPKTVIAAGLASEEDVRHVLGYFGMDGGHEAGSFTTKLLSAIAHADQFNALKLARAFPELVLCMDMARYQEDGIELLQEAIGICKQ